MTELLPQDIHACVLHDQRNGYSKLTWKNIISILDHVSPEQMTNRQLSEFIKYPIQNVTNLTLIMYKAGAINKEMTTRGNRINLYYSYNPQRDGQ